MIGISDDHDLSSVFAFPPDNAMYFLYKWTGRIGKIQSVFADQIINLFRNAMGTDHNGTLFYRKQIFFSIQHLYAFFFQIPHYLFVVDDRPVSVNRLFFFCCQIIDLVNGTFYAKTKTRSLCFYHFHCFTSL